MIVFSYHKFAEEPLEYRFSRTYSQFEIDLKEKLYDLITIDDAMDCQIKACEIMRERNIRAKLFTPTSLVGQRGYCNWDDLRKLSKYHDIENHSHSHENLTELDIDTIYHNIHKANLIIELEIGRKPRYFVPPYNKTNKHVDNIADKLGLIVMKNRVDILNTTV